ncbi:hypothetical protein Tco_0173846 [Tanacetum coccineum]
MFIKYSTGQIPPKKNRGKGSQGKKTTYTHVADVDVSEESDPKPPKRKSASRRVVQKKVTISTDDNIISDDLYVALELGKSIIKTEAEEVEAARQVHATHARIMTESVPEPTRRRKSSKVTSDPPKRLKGVPSLTPEEQEVADTMQALKESRKTNRRQPGTRGSNEGTGTIPGVSDESTVVFATSSEGTGTKPGVPDEEKDDKDTDANDEGDDHISDTQDDDDEDAETKYDVDEIYKYKIHVRKDVDVEMAEPKIVEHENKEKDVLTHAAKPDVKKNAEEDGDAEKAAGSNLQVKESTKFPLPSSSLSVSSGFGTQFINSSSDISLTGVLKDTAEADKVPVSMIPETTNLPPILEIHTKTSVSIAVSSPHVTPTISTVQQTSTPIPTPPITTDAPTITTVVPESNALFAAQLRVAKMEKDVSELKKIDLSAKALAALKKQVPSVVDNYLRSKVGDVFQKELKKHMAYLIQKYSLKQIPKLLLGLKVFLMLLELLLLKFMLILL